MHETELSVDDSTVIRPDWVQRVVPVPLVLFVSAQLLFTTANFATISRPGARPSPLFLLSAAVLVVAALAALWVLRPRATVLTDRGISCQQTRRPWRPGQLFIPWHEVAAIEGRKGLHRWQPVLHRTDGSVVWVRTPQRTISDRRFAESLDPLRERHAAAIGRRPGEIVVPPLTDEPGLLRRLLVTLGCVAALAASAAVVSLLILP
ncbi:hypothetical protein [Nocardia sp. NPDC048505]|uniref:hypothetical protein n=1 Tax=unclassified Nocardia TaxID=2637762 RepID=UPI0033D41AAE